VCTLNPGDIILTGTPDGSGIFQSPPLSLAVGDVVKVEIEGIGAILNRVVDEPPVIALQ
jgi:2-keto-4-pentenoate hydratase/2-oxohepta-3-ene-1,7-dioic acid hydratase in catechol pathway